MDPHFAQGDDHWSASQGDIEHDVEPCQPDTSNSPLLNADEYFVKQKAIFQTMSCEPAKDQVTEFPPSMEIEKIDHVPYKDDIPQRLLDCEGR